MKHIREALSSQKLTWLNIVGANAQDKVYLKNKFKFHDADLDEAMARTHAARPKTLFRPHYVFAVFLFPYLDAKTGKVHHTEVDFFITADHVITTHYNVTGNLNSLFAELKKDKRRRDIYLTDSPALFMYELLRHIYLTKYPILDHISTHIDSLEDRIYERQARKIIENILLIKRNIVSFKKTMLAHQNMLEQLRDFSASFWRTGPDTAEFFNRLLRHVKLIWVTLTNYYETINALEDTNNALVTFKLNDIMRTLTIFSVIVFPLTLLAAIFGMNTQSMPLVGQENDFWIIIGIMGLGTVAMFIFFRKKDWI